MNYCHLHQLSTPDQPLGMQISLIMQLAYINPQILADEHAHILFCWLNDIMSFSSKNNTTLSVIIGSENINLPPDEFI
jgi:hypothetical protein